MRPLDNRADGDIKHRLIEIRRGDTGCRAKCFNELPGDDPGSRRSFENPLRRAMP